MRYVESPWGRKCCLIREQKIGRDSQMSSGRGCEFDVN